MTARNLIFVFAALVIAGATAFFVRSWLMSQQPETVVVDARTPAPVPHTRVLVAKETLPAGTFIREEHLEWQPWPEGAVTERYIVEGQTDTKAVVGSVVRRGIAAGEPITPSKIVAPGERGFLAAVLKPGMRAVAIPVTRTSGIAGLIFPGDRVDILMTHDLPAVTGAIPATAAEEGQPSEGQSVTLIPPSKASETVLQNVRVLAMDQTLNDQKTGEPIKAETATIEVTPRQAEVISVMSEMGRLTLSLRSLGNTVEPAADASHVARSGAEGGSAQLNPLLAALFSRNQGAASAEGDDNPPPDRGETFTLDTDVSQLLKGRTEGAGPVITVMHGKNTEKIKTQGD